MQPRHTAGPNRRESHPKLNTGTKTRLGNTFVVKTRPAHDANSPVVTERSRHVVHGTQSLSSTPSLFLIFQQYNGSGWPLPLASLRGESIHERLDPPNHWYHIVAGGVLRCRRRHTLGTTTSRPRHRYFFAALPVWLAGRCVHQRSVTSLEDSRHRFPAATKRLVGSGRVRSDHSSQLA